MHLQSDTAPVLQFSFSLWDPSLGILPFKIPSFQNKKYKDLRSVAVDGDRLVSIKSPTLPYLLSSSFLSRS